MQIDLEPKPWLREREGRESGYRNTGGLHGCSIEWGEAEERWPDSTVLDRHKDFSFYFQGGGRPGGY